MTYRCQKAIFKHVLERLGELLMILACQNISKAFGTNEIIKNASFHIEDREKTAIVGINGAGKSTLLKIIMQEMPADSGEVIITRGKSIGYLAQHQSVTNENTIYTELLEVKRTLLNWNSGFGLWNRK